MNGLGGLVSGIDTGALIQAVLQQQRIPILRLQQSRESADIKISRFGDFMSKMDTLKTNLEDNFSKLGEILALSGTSADEDVFTVTANGDATAGSYDVDVNSLAVYEKDRSQAFNSPFAEVREGTLKIGHGPDPDWVEIDIADGDTLEEVVAKVNASGAKVDASIVNDGQSSYMQIVAHESGFDTDGTADQAIRLDQTYTGASGQELNLTQFQQAENAEVVIDGLNVTSRTNSLGDVLPGVTIDLVAQGSSSFNVEKDKAGTIENLQAFVDTFNEIATLIDEELDIDGEQTRDRSLSGESSVRTLQSELAAAVGHDIEGLENATFSSLSEIGITRDDDGKLSLDTGDLEDAIDSNIVAVGQLFTVAKGLSSRLSLVVDDYTDSDTGIFTGRKEALTKSQDFIDERIERYEVRIEKRQEIMEQKFLQMELAMSQMQQQAGALASLYTTGLGG